MAKQKDDVLTQELPGMPKRRGRPKGAKPAKTAAERMRLYREKRRSDCIRSFDLSGGDRALLSMALQDFKAKCGEKMKGEIDELKVKLDIDFL